MRSAKNVRVGIELLMDKYKTEYIVDSTDVRHFSEYEKSMADYFRLADAALTALERSERATSPGAGPAGVEDAAAGGD